MYILCEGSASQCSLIGGRRRRRKLERHGLERDAQIHGVDAATAMQHPARGDQREEI